MSINRLRGFTRLLFTLGKYPKDGPFRKLRIPCKKYLHRRSACSLDIQGIR